MALATLVAMPIPSDCTYIANLYEWAVGRNLIEFDKVIKFLTSAADATRNKEELKSLAELLHRLPSDADDFEVAEQQITDSVVFCLGQNVDELVSETEALSGIDYGDYSAATAAVRRSITESLRDFAGLTFSEFAIDQIVNSCDVEDQLDSHYKNGDGDSERRFAPAEWSYNASAGIDDIFDRG